MTHEERILRASSLRGSVGLLLLMVENLEGLLRLTGPYELRPHVIDSMTDAVTEQAEMVYRDATRARDAVYAEKEETNA